MIPWRNSGYMEFNEALDDILNNSQVDIINQYFSLVKFHSKSRSKLISGTTINE